MRCAAFFCYVPFFCHVVVYLEAKPPLEHLDPNRRIEIRRSQRCIFQYTSFLPNFKFPDHFNALLATSTLNWFPKSLTPPTMIPGKSSFLLLLLIITECVVNGKAVGDRQQIPYPIPTFIEYSFVGENDFAL